MIRLRLNPLSNNETLFKHKDGAILKDELEKILSTKNLKFDDIEIFHVLKDGKEVSDFNIEIKSDDNILVAPRVKGGGGFSDVLRTSIVVGATLVGNYYLPGGGGALLGSVAGGLLANSLVPPSDPGLPSLGSAGLGDSIETSQMYSISGQSNSSKPYAIVPKVYGTFKMFPNVVGQPYTEVEIDPSTGKPTQVLYAMYDFGLGPMQVNEIKIGDTELENFSDVRYRLVDPNKPLTDEGPWDSAVSKEFEIYKGDVSVTEDPYVLNKNREGSFDVGTDPDEYQVIRTGTPNPNGYQQEILLNFTFPQGLFSVNNQNATGTATVELEIEFAPTGTNAWVPYNGTQTLNYTSTSGVDSVGAPIPRNLVPFTVTPFVEYVELGSPYVYSGVDPSTGKNVTYTRRQYGFPKGSTIAYLTDTVTLGLDLQIDGLLVGKVVDNNTWFTGWRVVVNQPFVTDIPIYRTLQTVSDDGSINTTVVEPGQSSSGRVEAKTILSKIMRIRASERSQYFAQVKFTPRVPDQYDVRITRKLSSFQYTTARTSTVTYQNYITRFQIPTVNTDKRHVFMELAIRSTNQLNGQIQELNAVCSSVIPVYDDVSETWNLEVTSNPAWIFADLLTGQVNKRAISQSRLDVDSLVEWANFSDEIPTTPPSFSDDFLFPRFSCNFILDFNSTVKEVLGLVTGSAQASLNLVDGKYGVLIDRQKTTPIQVFTPRNYSNFSANRNYAEEIQGFNVKYNDPNDGWVYTERSVFADGFDATNTTKDLEDLKSFGVTNNEQSWRHGRFMLAQAVLRQETYSINVDFENLVCTRGDFVQLTQDSMKIGGRPARVNSVSGIRITIDDGIDTQVGPTYAYVFRNSSGISAQATLTPITSDTFDLDGTIPNVGDLIVIGELDSVVLDCVVKSITPQDDLTATLQLVEKVDAVYESLETGLIPPYVPQITDASFVSLEAPGEVQLLQIIDNYFVAGEGQFNYFIDIGWLVPITGGITERYEVYVDRGEGFELFDLTKEINYTYPVDRDFLGIEHCFKVLAVSSGGQKKDLGQVGDVCATPERKTTPAPNVENFNINITNQVIQLSWNLIDVSEGIQEYFIRYSPNLDTIWENSIPLTKADSRTSKVSVQGRVGTYLIKAVDFEGNFSELESKAITSIPQLFDLNIVQEIEEAPAWTGGFDRVQLFGDVLILQKETPTDYYSEGFYYFTSTLEFGLNYTVRIQNLIEAGGFSEDDLMINWPTLDSVAALSTATGTDWDVELQIRYTDQILFMDSWLPLSDVTSLAEGDIDDFVNWVSVTTGDFTGRVFSFRLKLSSFLPGVTPRVFSSLVRADMPDRVDEGNNITSSVLGTQILYDPPFFGPGTTPSIQITQDDASTGDYFTITSKSLDGFTITFYDSTDTAVVRIFDYYAKGFGYKNDTFI